MTSAARSPKIGAERRRRRQSVDKATAGIAKPLSLPPGKNRVPSASQTLDLFRDDALPQGFRYQSDFLTAEGEQSLAYQIERLPFKEFEFHGFIGKRRTVSFGWRYDFNGGGLTKTDDIPQFLLGLKANAEIFAELSPGTLQQILVTEYRPGAAIGWHKDRSVFGDVVGVSLLSGCSFRFRRKSGSSWDRRKLTAKPRSVYLLRGPSRSEWEHSIPPVETLRYSVTFRNVLEGSVRP
jgi:alkylated DNA repair dioxygenase AlkB